MSRNVRKPVPAKRDRGRMKAKFLRIGDPWGRDGKIRILNETCGLTPGPHVHVVSSQDGAVCLEFEQYA